MIAAAIQMKPRHLDEKFQMYLTVAYDGERLEDEQFLEVRRAFFAGAAALFGIFSGLAVTSATPVEEDDEGLDAVDAISDELADFQERLMRGDA